MRRASPDANVITRTIRFVMMTIMAIVVDTVIWKSHLLMSLTFDAHGEDGEAYVALSISCNLAVE